MKKVVLISQNKHIIRCVCADSDSPWTVLVFHEIDVFFQLPMHDICAVVLDFDCVCVNGFNALKYILAHIADIPLLLISSPVNLCFVVESIKCGAVDFIEFPCSLEHIERKIKKYISCLSFVSLLQAKTDSALSALTGSSSSICAIRTEIMQYAQSDLPILILGESGTGKTVAAKLIHEHSGRFQKPFCSYNVASLHENLIESELFGTVCGAFTDAKDRLGLFEAARNGTLFLDEIGELPLSVQVKILHAIESGEIRRVGCSEVQHTSVRLVFATNKNISEAIKHKTMREDLFYRINVLTIYMPPLRQRKEDIPLLIAQFLSENTKVQQNQTAKVLNPAALEKLMEHEWIGNIRELKNCMQRALVLCCGDIIFPEHIRFL